MRLVHRGTGPGYLAERAGKLTKRALYAFSRASPFVAWAWVASGLAVSWLIAYTVGGAGVAAPHWFYLPVLYAGARFGCPGAAVSAVAAGVLAGPLMPLDVSAGIAQRPEDWLTRAAFFLIIGQAMGLLVSLSQSAIRAEFERLHMENELRAGILHDEYVLHYQPIVGLVRGQIEGVEALVRWQHPKWGLVPPERFIEAAETSGVISLLGEHVLGLACRQLAAWQSGPLRDRERFKLAVNLSALQLDDRRLAAHVEATIQSLGIEPSWLILEVTETGLVADVDDSAERLRELKALGVMLAIDDFGTGRASLSYLRDFPVDAVKIDRSFIGSLAAGGRASEITHAVVRLARDLGMSAIAEGVETADQVVKLRRLGCDLAQGYFFSKPLPPDELAPLLAAKTPFGHLVPAVHAGKGRALALPTTVARSAALPASTPRQALRPAASNIFAGAPVRRREPGDVRRAAEPSAGEAI